MTHSLFLIILQLKDAEMLNRHNIIRVSTSLDRVFTNPETQEKSGNVLKMLKAGEFFYKLNLFQVYSKLSTVLEKISIGNETKTVDEKHIYNF